MIEVYSADIRCENKNSTQFKHVDSLDEEVSLGEMLLRLKKEFDNLGIFVQLTVEDLDGHKYVAKYKFSDEVSCLKEIIPAKVDSLWRIGDDGGAIVIIKIKKEQNDE